VGRRLVVGNGCQPSWWPRASSAPNGGLQALVGRIHVVGLAALAVIATTGWSRPAAATHDWRPQTDATPTDLRRARTEILDWVATERHPTREWARLFPQDPATTEHDYRVAFTVNYALLAAGATPGKAYTANEFARMSEAALWTLTRDLREADPMGSQSLVLRDGQRYLYGSLGDRWLQRHVAMEYAVPHGLAPYLPGWVINRGYEAIKTATMLGNAIGEETTGTNPGWGRIKKDLPHSPPGGDAWYERGLAQFGAMNPSGGTPATGSPFITGP
jgi:hypothetical protein